MSLVGPQATSTLHALARLSKTTQCTIVESHATQMNGTLALVMQLRGTWNAIAKFETQLPKFGQKWGCQILSQRHEVMEPAHQVLPYSVQITALDRVGIYSEFTKFFEQRKIPIHHISSETYHSNRATTPMCFINAVVMIADTFNIPGLREQFLSYCEEYNLDGSLEPQKWI